MSKQSIRELLATVAETGQFKPYEQIWLHTDKQGLQELDNIAKDTTKQWQLADDVELPSGATLVHTHVHSQSVTGFSLEDWPFIDQHPELKHYMYHVPTGLDAYFDYSSDRPYTKRLWSWSTDNCHSLCREWLRRETGLLVDAFHIQDNGQWVTVDFAAELNKAGFRAVQEPQWSDVVLMQGGHIGIYLDKNQVLHHLVDRASAITSILGPVTYWRHGNTPQTQPVTLLDPNGRLLYTNTLQMPLTKLQHRKLLEGSWSQAKGYRLVKE